MIGQIEFARVHLPLALRPGGQRHGEDEEGIFQMGEEVMQCVFCHGHALRGEEVVDLLHAERAAGMGEQMNSWIGSGQNLPVSPEQMGSVLGQDQLSQMAERMGLSTGDLGAQLSQMLPQAVDQFTPEGRVPEGGLGNLGDLLGGLLRR